MSDSPVPRCSQHKLWHGRAPLWQKKGSSHEGLISRASSLPLRSDSQPSIILMMCWYRADCSNKGSSVVNNSHLKYNWIKSKLNWRWRQPPLFDHLIGGGGRADTLTYSVKKHYWSVSPDQQDIKWSTSSSCSPCIDHCRAPSNQRVSVLQLPEERLIRMTFVFICRGHHTHCPQTSPG